MDSLKEIDFESWKGKINTKGLVDKIQNNYIELCKEEYDMKEASKSLQGDASLEDKNIDSLLIYHNEIWMEFYLESLE